jgi:hypothetical protein
MQAGAQDGIATACPALSVSCSWVTLLTKLGARDRAQLVIAAYDAGLARRGR